MSNPSGSIVEHRWWWWVAAISLAGWCIRVAFVVFGSRIDGPVGDQLFYSAQALANARGDWFQQPFAEGVPAADHPPLTALVITPVTWLFEWTGSFVTAQRLTMTLLGVGSIPLVALLARRIGNHRSGIFAAVITAVYVNVWVNDGLIMAETLTFVLLVLLSIALLQVQWDSRFGKSIQVGILAGLCALTRPELVLLVPLLSVFFVFSLREHLGVAKLLRNIAAMILVACAVVAPWVVWNQFRFDGPVLLSTNDGLTLAGANCDSTYFEDLGGWDIRCAYATEIPDDFDAAQASEAMRRDGLAYWREHVDRYPVVAAARLARVFSIGFIGATAEAATAEGRPVWLSHLGTVQYWLLIPFAIVGARRSTTGIQRLILLGAIPIVIVTALGANAYVRFRVPAEVGLVVLAALGFDVSRAAIMRYVSGRALASSRGVPASHELVVNDRVTAAVRVLVRRDREGLRHRPQHIPDPDRRGGDR